jgi:hypothetical protein
MTISEYAQTLVKLIEARPSHIDLDELLAEVNVRAKMAEAGHWTTKEHAMKDSWNRSHSKLGGQSTGKGTSRTSSTKRR